MKKHSRLTALLLGVFILLTAVASCSRGTSGDTTANGTTDSCKTETTDIVSASTTEEPSVSAAVSPETTAPEADSSDVPETTVPPDTTVPPEITDETTAPPSVNDTLRILTQNDSGEALLSMFSDEEDKTLLDARRQRLLYEYSVGLAVYQTTDIVSKVKNDAEAENSEYDLVLLTPDSGVKLMISGSLENLGEAGIGINSESAGVRKKLTESLTLGTGTYLLACDALVSDITSAYALRYDGTSLSSDPVSLAVSGAFTAEQLLTYIIEIGDSAFSFDESDNIALYAGVGGKVFIKNEKDVPLSALSEDSTFTQKYNAVLSLASKNANDDESVFTLTKLSAAKEGEIFLPLPKLSADTEYSSLLDADTVSLFAAPAGVVGGNRLATLFNALNMTSSDYREAVHERLSVNSGIRGKKLIEIIEKSTCLDLGILLGWGDIDALISKSINESTLAETLLSDRITIMQNEAVKTASDIIADRLGIK